MSLILKYRVEPHPGINNEIYQALVEQVGKVGIQMQLKIGPPENPEETVVIVHGQFISVEGEHYQERMNAEPILPKDLDAGSAELSTAEPGS
jgi:hypothetical protein